jgi:hypothetical protein
MSDFAPVVIFAYRRPDMLRRTLKALASNKGIEQSELFIFCDGPKANASEQDLSAIREVRELASGFLAASKLHTIFRESNMGLAQSVLTGVDQVIQAFGKIIVVEDDVELSPHFLSFMNASLHQCQNIQQIGAIGSWNYFLGKHAMHTSFLLRYSDSIAWATWKDRWDLLERDGKKLAAQLANQQRLFAFNANNQVNWFSEMLRDQQDGKVDSWAIRWTASLVLHDRLTLFPAQSLSRHIGFGKAATHETGNTDYNAELMLASEPQEICLPEIPKEDEEAFKYWVDFNRQTFQGNKGIKTLVWRMMPKGLQTWYKRRQSKGNSANSIFETQPVSRIFGIDRGTPVDRFFIEHFLHQNKNAIKGEGLEIGEVRYLKQFGAALHSGKALVYDAAQGSDQIHGDLTHADKLPTELADVFICTQTLNFIYDVPAAIKGIQQLLKTDGVALVTVAGICQISRYDADRWGDYWRFMPQSIFRLFAEQFGAEHVEMQVYGNVYAAHMLLHGYALEECQREKLLVKDDDYPVVIGLKITKR